MPEFLQINFNEKRSRHPASFKSLLAQREQPEKTWAVDEAQANLRCQPIVKRRHDHTFATTEKWN